MKAAVFEDIGEVRVRDVPDPSLEPGDALVRIEACNICGTDRRIMSQGHTSVRPPWILGHEIVGTVVETPSDSYVPRGARVVVVPGVHCGNCRECASGRPEVCTFKTSIGYQYPGGFAEYVRVPSVFLRFAHLLPVPYPAARSPELALTEPLSCVLKAHRRARTSLGDTVVVLGAGPIGVMHCLVAQLRGASVVIAYDPVAAAAARAGRFSGIVAKADLEGLREELRRRTDGRGADVVVIANSAPKSQAMALDLVASGGRLLLFAGLGPQAKGVAWDANRIHYNDIEVIGTVGGAMSDAYLALDLLGTGRINGGDLVSHEVSLEDFNNGLALAKSGEALRVAVVPGFRG